MNRREFARLRPSDRERHANHMRLMSSATKRGKLLPDLLLARDAVLPDAATDPAGGRPAQFAAIEARSRPSILNWILVRRTDLAREVPAAAMKGRTSAPQSPRQRDQRGKSRPQPQLVAAGDAAVRGDARLPADAMFYAKGDATPAASRRWWWDREALAEASPKSAPCGRRAKAKARRNAP